MASRSRSLGHIARHFDIRDWINSLVALRFGNDRDAAIVGTSMIDRGLEAAILREFVALSKRQIEAIFEGNGPLISLSAKIKIGYALGIFAEHARDDLEKIRKVRNAFAHSIQEVSFDTPEVRDICNSISFPGQVKEIEPRIDQDWEIDTHKGKFLMAVFLYANLFLCAPETPSPSPDKPGK